MYVISMICMCIVCLFILCGLAGLVCFIGSQTESLLIVMGSMILTFFVGHIVLSLTFALLSNAYNLPVMPWQSGVE